MQGFLPCPIETAGRVDRPKDGRKDGQTKHAVSSGRVRCWTQRRKENNNRVDVEVEVQGAEIVACFEVLVVHIRVLY